MTTSRLPILLLVLTVSTVAACSPADAQSSPADRASQIPLIVEEVLRYGIQEFAVETARANTVLCLAIREGSALTDPSPEILRRLDGKHAQPQSKCSASRTLIAGPVVWVGDDEVRVAGGLRRTSKGEARLSYRVVREDGRWVCLGRIISWDPL